MFSADYYDGIHPQAQRVSVDMDGQTLVLTNQDQTQRFAVKDCEIQTQFGKGQNKRIVDLPDGSRLESVDPDLAICLASVATQRSRALHFLENHKLSIALALLGVVFASHVFLTQGIPLLAEGVALTLPASVEQRMGKEALATLDDPTFGYFMPSTLPQAKTAAVRNALAQMCARTKTCPSYRLHFRASPKIGPNAFALPGGDIVMTDELVKLSERNAELVSVLAHELGHVKQHHTLRQALQGTIAGLLVLAVTGDMSSVAAGLPVFMMQMHYTRDMENEADTYALQQLKAACISPKYFASLLSRLEKTLKDEHIPEWLASHPDTQKRIQPCLVPYSACEHI